MSWWVIAILVALGILVGMFLAWLIMVMAFKGSDI